jgi:hypothetical protein
MEVKELAYRDAHFQEELKFLKASVTCLIAYSSKHLDMPLVKLLLTDPSPLFRPQQQLSWKK